MWVQVRLFISLIFFLLISSLRAGDGRSKIDSLKGLLESGKEDTSAVLILSRLSDAYRKYEDLDTAMYYADKALKVSERINFITGKAVAYNAIGLVYSDMGQHKRAINYYRMAIEIHEQEKDSRRLAIVRTTLGVNYFKLGDYPKALEAGLKALAIAEKSGPIKLLHVNLNNVGNIYYRQKEYEKAKFYYEKALKLAFEMKNLNMVSVIYGNIANIYVDQKIYKEAREMYIQALRSADEAGDKQMASRHLGSIGLVYDYEAQNRALNEAERKQLRITALEYYQKGLALKKEVGDMGEVGITLGNIGAFYFDIGDYKNSFNYTYRALAIADSFSSKYLCKSWYEALSLLYENSTIPLPDTIGGKLLGIEQMRLRALYYHKRFISISDQLFSEESNKELVRKEMNYEFDKREVAAKMEQEKKDALVAEEKRRQYVLLALLAFVALAVGVVAFIIFRSLRVTRAQKEVIEEQKYLVEEKQKEILDSIYYARRIQRTLLPREDYISKALTRLTVTT